MKVVAHVILGLPGEDREMALATAGYLAGQKVWGVKMHTLMVLEHTGLAGLYRKGSSSPGAWMNGPVRRRIFWPVCRRRCLFTGWWPTRAGTSFWPRAGPPTRTRPWPGFWTR